MVFPIPVSPAITLLLADMDFSAFKSFLFSSFVFVFSNPFLSFAFSFGILFFSCRLFYRLLIK